MVNCPTCPPPDEEWRQSRSWPRYEVSNHGRVRSIDRVILNSRGVLQRRPGVILKPRTAEYGYKIVGLFGEGGLYRQVRVHLLVLEEFCAPKQDPRHEARHGPGGAGDNHPENLCWGTKAENNGPDKVRDGTSNRGERQWQAKLTTAQVIEIRARYAAGGISQKALGAEYGVHQVTVGEIVRRVCWAHIP